MAQQTAVEWAMSQIIKGHFIGFAEEFQIILEQAKAIEKEQIIKAYANGSNDRLHNFINEQYYNQTFGK